MDGLDCTEEMLSTASANKDFRIDSQFYTINVYQAPSTEYIPIGDCLTHVQYGISIPMNDTEEGFPIYRMDEIHNMLCDAHATKYALISKEKFLKHQLQNGDVLFNRTNSYEWVGRTGIYYDTGVPQTFASYLVRLVTDRTKILPEYLAAYLSCQYGISDIKRRARQSINQTNVNPEEVKAMQIPLLGSALQEKIKFCFVNAHKMKLDAIGLFKEAAKILLVKLEYSSHPPIKQSVSVKLLSESLKKTGRIDAEYYQPKYEQYIYGLNTSDTVFSLCKIHDENFEPKGEECYSYIELANVGTEGEIANVETILGNELPTRARRKVKAGQVIVSSIEGSLQSCALVQPEYDGALCSTGFYVLSSDSINSETLLVLFKSEPIQALMKQRCSGTILMGITKDEFLSMPLPRIANEAQEQIASIVQQAFSLRQQSEQLLNYAKQAVELAIEQGEDVAMAWLKEKGGNG